jgi:hypothetical protein
MNAEDDTILTTYDDGKNENCNDVKNKAATTTMASKQNLGKPSIGASFG